MIMIGKRRNEQKRRTKMKTTSDSGETDKTKILSNVESSTQIMNRTICHLSSTTTTANNNNNNNLTLSAKLIMSLWLLLLGKEFIVEIFVSKIHSLSVTEVLL